ncbi:MAG: PepSY domain-containing protein [Candidatus Nanoarchaeia archaeon]
MKKINNQTIRKDYIDKSDNYFMLKGVIAILVFGILLIEAIGFVSAEENALGCKNLYWIDNDNKECLQKEFCGAYMYYGLQTFETKDECLGVVNENKTESCACTMDAKICPDGSAVGRVCPNCEFESCKKGVNKTCPSQATGEEGKCMYKLSNGRRAEIKIMPETASHTAINRLGELNFTIELKESGKDNESKPIYELTGKKQGKFLGIIKIMASEKVLVDAQTGEVISLKKPWWAFLATRI